MDDLEKELGIELSFTDIMQEYIAKFGSTLDLPHLLDENFVKEKLIKAIKSGKPLTNKDIGHSDAPDGVLY